MTKRFTLLSTLVIAIANQSSFAMHSMASEDQPAPEAKRQIVKLHKVETGQASGNANATAHMFVVNAGEAPAGDLHEILVDHAPVSNIEAGGPWIGVQFGPVPKPLAAQLGLQKDSGQMVLNVIEDSPAEISGITQYDVIVNIDGQPVSSDLGGFLDTVRTFQPGEKHVFTLLRGAQLIDVTITVGTRPDDFGKRAYLFEDDMGHVARGNVIKRGGIVMKNGNGDWTFNPLDGDQGAGIWKALPDLKDGNFDTFFETMPLDGHPNMLFESVNGESIKIDVADDGKVTVTKTTKNGDDEETTTDTYASMEEFERLDPDAAKSHGNMWSFKFQPQGDHDVFFQPLNGKTFRLRLNKDDQDLDIDVQLEALDERVKGLLEKSEDMLAEIHVDGATGAGSDQLKRFKFFGHANKGDGNVGSVFFASEAKTRFSVAPDGVITLTTREGDDELVQTFDNADQLKAAMPDYYTRYEKLLNIAKGDATK